MRTYELMTIHRHDLAEADYQSAVDEIEKSLSAWSAEVTDKDLWGKRRFAYEIDHMNEGYYSVVTFKSENADPVDNIDRVLSLADEVVRHKIVKLDV